ncbi:MAG: EamA family transporter, partial [Clostridia bacterium]|nr:EamA family transporter [Clostridia bacterium]
ATSVLYTIGFYASYLALSCGSFGLTQFYSSFGGILTIVYAIAVLGETTGRFFYLAVALKFLAMFLIQYKASKSSDNKFSLKWFISLMLNILANVAITIVNKWQQDHFEGKYRNEYLTVIFICSALVLFILGMIYERDSFKATIKQGFLYGMAAGLLNGMNNVFTLAVYYYLPISFSGPFRGGLAMLLTFVIAALIYKEKFTLRQYIGAAVGVASVVLLNIK